MYSTSKNKSKSPPIIKTLCITIVTNAWTNLQNYSTKKSLTSKKSRNLPGTVSLSNTEETSGDCFSSTCPQTRTISSSPSIENEKTIWPWWILTFYSPLYNKTLRKRKPQNWLAMMFIEHCPSHNCLETKKYREWWGDYCMCGTWDTLRVGMYRESMIS